MDNEPEQIFVLNSSENVPLATTQKETPATQVNLEDVLDFSTVCRTCATITEFVIPIFQGEGLQNNLAEKIHKYLPIKVSEEDELPVVVCYQCASTLLACHELAQCSRHAETALRARLPHLPRRAPPPPPPPPLAVQQNTDVEPSQTNENVEKNQPETKSHTSLLFYEHVKSVMVNYLNPANVDEDLDMECVCQLCTDHPSATSVLSLTEHLLTAHGGDVKDIQSVEKFIRDNITFVEVLVSEDSDRDMESDAREVTENKLPSFYCPFCDNAFSSPTRLIFHLNRHVEVCIDNAVVCCDVTYNNKKSFVTHLQEKHVSRAPDEFRVHKCRSCAYSAEDIDALQLHVNEHHSDQRASNKIRFEQSSRNQKFIPAVCPECNKTFSNKYNMFVHMKSHSDKKNTTFQCDRCDKSYSNQWNLKNHKKQVHDGILNFVCSGCGEAFPTRLARDVHSRIHTGDKPYSCTVCKKSFRAKNTLDRHMEIHLNVRKYECHLCQKKFRKRSHLNYHLSTHKKTK
ncbi:zinc finger protein 271-like isoform X3 [Galleria mellonella]|uniref:Zinc finger protein 271-like isoform X3 n=1 Tax=Galleria mellonella TaxID=7137 RepID=A0ABM3MYY7_GALME|nr:zinc finger protein 271-like isoform X3 [Galleria mellonella]